MSTDYLRRHAALRDYLHRFDEREWPEVVKLTMLFGVQSMKLNSYQMQTMTIEKLKELCAQGGAATSVQEALPDLEQTLDLVREQISSLKGELDPSHLAGNRALAPLRDPAAQTQFMSPSAPEKIPAGWRNTAAQNRNREARSHYSRQTVHGLYDAHGSVSQALDHVVPAVSKRPKQPKKQRDPPRLAYSTRRADSTGEMMTACDLVTGRFIDVPSTSRSLHATLSDSEPVKQVRVVEEPSAAESSAALKKKAVVYKVPAHLRKVQSKIKERVRLDRAIASEHRSSRQQAIRNVARNGLNRALDDVEVLHDSVAANKRAATASGLTATKEPSVMDITESFLNNPLMKTFTGPRKDFDEYIFQSPPPGSEATPPVAGDRNPPASSLPTAAPMPSSMPDPLDSTLHSAPASVEDLAARLRLWVNPKDTAVPDDRTRSFPSVPTDEVLSSLRRASNQFEASSSNLASSQQWSILPNDNATAASTASALGWSTPAESDFYEGHTDPTTRSPFRGSDTVEWKFAQDAFN